MTGSFARRWSRLKRAASPAAPPAPEPVEIPPPAETIDLADIAGWLKRNVPDAWKTAALRRLWLSDPAIRDFIGPADYAWDWNTPGGAPGYGPLQAMDDVGKLLARAIGAPPPKETPPEAPPAVQAVPAPQEKVAVAAPTPSPPAPDPVEPVRRRGGGATPT
ncbi:DUF3306 domain-containing protein [Limobrevibacterium gyesilva]|uniref:DUF3306 domain-containing protein n=1 Tax=Limobrevibacterium gyesilva TaxID=2991712 RepID=A0AA41YP96_9PROT|nr:DUF3306 domain-containing protein [Limobrevibacterium gyesilva]MCW3474158.1 DUF3306 domain-containing protein [Limobrevibacterium gyesilva]